MNRHFKDSQYYLRRAASTAKHGIVEVFTPVRRRVAAVRGKDEEPAGRLDTLKERGMAGVRRARAKAERAVAQGRERINRRRGTVE